MSTDISKFLNILTESSIDYDQFMKTAIGFAKQNLKINGKFSKKRSNVYTAEIPVTPKTFGVMFPIIESAQYVISAKQVNSRILVNFGIHWETHKARAQYTKSMYVYSYAGNKWKQEQLSLW
jgi:hypothetical protein